MRIAYFSGSTIPSRSANSIHVMKMCQALARAGHDVFLIARRGDREEDDFGQYGVRRCFTLVKHRARRSPVGSEALNGLAAARGLGKIRPDLIYARHLLSLFAAVPRGTPFIFEAHAPPTRLERALLGILLKAPSFARLIVISEALRREFERLFPRLPARKIRVLHDAADPPAAGGGVSLGREGRRRGDLEVGYVGHLYPGKGMEVVVRLAARLPHFDFHVVGGTEADLRRWRERVSGLENVIFHGFVSPARADAYRRAMDVLVAPYQEKVAVSAGGDMAPWMSPLKIFEYMAARKAIAASDLPVLREVLRDGVEALLVPPGDLNAWEAALRRLADPDLRETLAAAAYRAFESRHTWAGRARAALAGL